MRNIKLLLEYDGTNYIGWQRQAEGNSIQGEIESSLDKILGESVILIGAGRTDAGVHARGQVANFRTSSDRMLEQIRGGLNGLLPEDVVVHQVEEVALEFHARYSATARSYSYLIARQRTALSRHCSWNVNYSLDLDLMKKTAESILGDHDFESFCKANSDVDHYRCMITESRWIEEGSFLRYVIQGNRFLHGMVRALVGTMVDVGRGYTTYEEFLDILEKKDRKEAGMAAPAKGLVLEKVIY